MLYNIDLHQVQQYKSRSQIKNSFCCRMWIDVMTRKFDRLPEGISVLDYNKSSVIAWAVIFSAATDIWLQGYDVMIISRKIIKDILKLG